MCKLVLDGRSILDKKLVIPDEDHEFEDEQAQPNGVDLRLDKVYEVSGVASLPTDGKMKFNGQVNEIPFKDGWLTLSPTTGFNYLVDFLEKIYVPAEYCALVIARSSLIRIGCDVNTGLWDAGFQGQLGASLRVRNQVKIQWGARMCQVMFYKSDFKGHYYAGRYQNTTSQTAF